MPLFNPLSNFLFQREIYFHTSKRYIPLKKKKKKTQHSVLCGFFPSCAQRRMNAGARRFSGVTQTTRLTSRSHAVQMLNLSPPPPVSWSKSRSCVANWVSPPVVAARGENCQRVMSNARAAPSTLPSRAELIQLNAAHMTAPFLTHGGWGGGWGGDATAVSGGSPVSLNTEVRTWEAPASPPVLEHSFASLSVLTE